jgi:putative glutamine amidotransferase
VVPAPLVAVTTYPAGTRRRVHLPVEYVESVRRAGGRAVLVAPGEPDPGGLLDAVQAVVLTGGGDLEPSTWGARAGDATVYETDIERDRTELALARAAVERGVPLLAICRGQQVLNVALGGTLHMDVPTVFGDAVAHRVPPRDPVAHPVAVEQGCRLAEIMGAAAVEPMSWHHQAVDVPGAGLRAVAWAPDGVIEALEHESHPWLVAVQWHPELTSAHDPTQAALFDALVAAATTAAGRSGSGP